MPRGWYGTTRECEDCGTPFVLKSKHDQVLCSRACAARRNTGKRKSTRVPWQERFKAFVPTERTERGCLEWTGSRDKHGYGRLARGGKHGGSLKAPRCAWELANVTIPPGLSVLHTCDNPPCIEPSHLFLGTKKDNTQDMLAKGRGVAPVGARNGKTKLSDDAIREMRERAAAGERLADLGRAYGIEGKHVWAIVTGRRRPTAGGPIRSQHAHAAELWREKIDLYTIMQQLGHSDPRVTVTYLKGITNLEAVEAIAARKPPMVPAL